MIQITDNEIEDYYKRYRANKRKLETISNPKITTRLTFLPMYHSGESKTETVATTKADLEREVNIVEMCYSSEVMSKKEMNWICYRYMAKYEKQSQDFDNSLENIASIMCESISTLKRIRRDVIRKTREMVTLSQNKVAHS